MVKFSLSPSIYAACYNASIIILDSETNVYLSLIGPAAEYFSFILQNTFVKNSTGYQYIEPLKTGHTLEQLNFWFSHFLEKKYIVESLSKTSKTLASLPLKPGGLTNYQWDFKVSWKPFSLASKLEIAKAFFQLAKIHYIIKKKKGVKYLLSEITQIQAQNKLCNPTQKEIDQLAAAVDAASILYPKKTFCLVWSITFVLLALKKRWPCNLVIGVQSAPFYAHAWAELAGQVVNDDPTIAQVLSIILKEPYK